MEARACLLLPSPQAEAVPPPAEQEEEQEVVRACPSPPLPPFSPSRKQTGCTLAVEPLEVPLLLAVMASQHWPLSRPLPWPAMLAWPLTHYLELVVHRLPSLHLLYRAHPSA